MRRKRKTIQKGAIALVGVERSCIIRRREGGIESSERCIWQVRGQKIADPITRAFGDFRALPGETRAPPETGGRPLTSNR